MAYISFDNTTGELHQISDFEIFDVPENSAITASQLTKLALETEYVWNKDSRSFEPRTNSRTITKLDYMNRFTDVELATIYTIAKTNVAVEIWLEKFKLATEINLDDPRTIGGVNALEQYGLIGVGRAMEILA